MARPRVADDLVDRLDYFVEEHTDVPNADALAFDDKLSMLVEAHESAVGEAFTYERAGGGGGVKQRFKR